MLMLWDVILVAGNWFYEAIFLKISSALHVHPGRECPCNIRKILGFHEWLLKALFLAANAGLWIGTYQLQEIAWNLELSKVEVEWNLPWQSDCHRTSFFFFSKSVPIPAVCSLVKAVRMPLWLKTEHLELLQREREEVPGSIPAVAARSLQVGLVSV